MKRVIAALDEAHARLAEAERRQHEPLAIVGMACRSPLGDDAEESGKHCWRDAMVCGRSRLIVGPRLNRLTADSPRRRAATRLHCCLT